MKPFLRCLVGGLTIVGATTALQAETRLQGAGATFPAPVYNRWATEYQKAHPDVKIDYEANGSGGGIKAITANTVQFGASDAPLNKKELAAAGAADGGDILELPTVAGAVVIAYNIPGLDKPLKLDGEAIANIYLGKITNWNDKAITDLNPDLKLPDQAITTVNRTDASGTNYIFTNYLATQSPDFGETIGTGKQVEWQKGSKQSQGGAGNAGVTAALQKTPGAIAYVELAYALEQKIPTALLKNKDGEFVAASPESVSAAGEGALDSMKDGGNGLAINIWNQPGKNSYPISSFTYLLIHKDLIYTKDKDKADALNAFIHWALTDGEKLAPDLNYAPLSEGVQKKVLDLLNTAVYDGKPLQ